MTAVNYGLAVKEHFSRCKVTAAEIIDGQKPDQRSLRVTKKVKECFKKFRTRKHLVSEIAMKNGNERWREYGQKILQTYSLPVWLSVVESFKDLRRVKEVSGYSVFTIKLLHKLHFGIVNMVKECSVEYSSSDRLKTESKRKKRCCLLKLESGWIETTINWWVSWKNTGSFQELV